ncbi:MAG: glycosyltransferase [Oscillospiraceae bacterium]|jgi:glycosyltransferase involved in cell wall biosynthesis|nr:glycosyltransferase [Oscillospiraceae bacterium]
MQPKVSIVIPCYNKVNYIANMFDSIIAQKWDNIEIILVNDGSTDGTREIITEYEHKFIKRSFDVVIIDQENKGLPSAVYVGFLQVTGDYVCQVDADDSLDKEYVSTLAGWLDDNSDYDWVVCDTLYVEEGIIKYVKYFRSDIAEFRDLSKLIELHLFFLVHVTVHEYMVRVDYLKKSGVLDNYYVDNKHTQEQQFVFPLIISGGKLKHITKPLYNYIQNDDMMSKRITSKDWKNYGDLYFDIAKETILRLQVTQSKKEYYLKIMKLAYYHYIYKYCLPIDKHINIEALEFVNSFLTNNAHISLSELLTTKEKSFRAIFDTIMGVNTSIPNKRRIAWGVLGNRGKEAMEVYNRRNFVFDELWDINGDGIAVKKPDISKLGTNDWVHIMPYTNISEKIANEITYTGCDMLVGGSGEEESFLVYVDCGQFFEGNYNDVIHKVRC